MDPNQGTLSSSACEVDIRPATQSEAGLLSDLAMQAKAHWGYPREVLESWKPELAVTCESIRTRPIFIAMVDDQVAGFCSLSSSGTTWDLDNLWVSPPFMHRGIGRALLSRALDEAVGGGAIEVTVDADPNAEAFYLQRGAVRRGEVPAPIPGNPDRIRPQLVFGTRNRVP